MTLARHREFQPGEYGTDINTEVAPFPTVANSSTTTINVGMAPRTQIFNQGFVSQQTLITSGGTVTVTIGKLDSTNSFAKVPLTAATSLLTGTQVAKQTYAIPALASLTDPQRLLLPADSLYADFTASSTVSAQAVAAIVGAELFIKR